MCNHGFTLYLVVNLRDSFSCFKAHMGLDVRKPVFWGSAKVRLKPVSSATDNSYEIEISLGASLDMVLSKKRTAKVLIRLRRCAGWSAPLLFCCSQLPEDRFSHITAHIIVDMFYESQKVNGVSGPVHQAKSVVCQVSKAKNENMCFRLHEILK